MPVDGISLTVRRSRRNQSACPKGQSSACVCVCGKYLWELGTPQHESGVFDAFKRERVCVWVMLVFGLVPITPSAICHTLFGGRAPLTLCAFECVRSRNSEQRVCSDSYYIWLFLEGSTHMSGRNRGGHLHAHAHLAALPENEQSNDSDIKGSRAKRTRTTFLLGPCGYVCVCVCSGL